MEGRSHLGIGIALGVAIGAGLGVAMDNLAMGIGVGVAIGVALGVALDASKGKGDWPYPSPPRGGWSARSADRVGAAACTTRSSRAICRCAENCRCRSSPEPGPCARG